MLRFRKIALDCFCGYRSEQVPVGYSKYGRVYFTAYFDGTQLVSVKYPLPTSLDAASSVEDHICEVVAQAHGNCIPGYFKIGCPDCGQQLQFVNQSAAISSA
jgi:hypothetical protein